MGDTERANGEISNVSLSAYVGDRAWEHARSLNHRDLCNLSPGSAGCSQPHHLSAEAAFPPEQAAVGSVHIAASCGCRQLPRVQAVAGCPQHHGDVLSTMGSRAKWLGGNEMSHLP